MAKAAQKPAADTNINLLPTPRSDTPLAVTTNWILNLGRFLIIATEIVALVIFLLSIKLSTDKNSIKEDIESLSAQITSASDFEKEFRLTKQRLDYIKEIRANHFQTNKVLEKFLSLLPANNFRLDSLVLEKDKITFSGSFLTPSELQTLVLSFSESEELVGLDLNELISPTRTNPRYTFKASVLINRESFKPN